MTDDARKLAKKRAKSELKLAKKRAKAARKGAQQGTASESRGGIGRLFRESLVQTIIKVVAGLIVAYLVIRFGLR